VIADRGSIHAVFTRGIQQGIAFFNGNFFSIHHQSDCHEFTCVSPLTLNNSGHNFIADKTPLAAV
jgi:hypothetical protein